jgi:ribosome-binding factor A
MAKPIRVEKVSSEIERVLSLILQHDVHDSRVSEHFGSLTRVDLTGDLKHAKVLVSVYGSEEDKRSFMEGLESAKGFIRSELGKQTTLRYVPALHFKLDRSFEEGAHVISLLDDLKAKGEL